MIECLYLLFLQILTNQNLCDEIEILLYSLKIKQPQKPLCSDCQYYLSCLLLSTVLWQEEEQSNRCVLILLKWAPKQTISVAMERS